MHVKGEGKRETEGEGEGASQAGHTPSAEQNMGLDLTPQVRHLPD